MSDFTVDLSPLHRRLDQLDVQLDSGLTEIQQNIGSLHGDINSTQAELLELRRMFEEYVGVAERTANLQRSETNVGNLKAELDRQFGHYSVVRHSSLGLLQAFDVGNVTNEIAGAVSEELMIQSPRYWLAPALVALAAWSRDDRTVADVSVREAFSRSPEKTSLFFSLVLRRQRREDASLRWLRHYFNALDPTALNREFAVILEASAQEAFGAAGKQLSSEILARWNHELRSRQDIVDTQIEKWEAEIGVLRGRVDEHSYATLVAASPDWPQIKAQLEATSALPEVTDKLAAVRDTEFTQTTAIENLLDDLLEQLITEYDDEELPLRREVAYHQAVIEEFGDLARAQARADVQLNALEETIDAVSLQTMAAIAPESLGVSVQTQRVAIGAGQADLRAAVGRFTAGYRSQALNRARLELGPQHSNYAISFNFTGWRGWTNEPEPVATERLYAAWDQTFTQHIDKVRFKYTAAIVPGLIGLGVALVASLVGTAVGFILAFLAVAAAGVYVFLKKQRCDAAVAEAENSREMAKRNSREVLGRIQAEFVDAMLVYEELDESEPGLIRMVDTWPTGVTQ